MTLFGDSYVCTEEDIWKMNEGIFELKSINISKLKAKNSRKIIRDVFKVKSREEVQHGTQYDDIEMDIFSDKLDEMYSDVFDNEPMFDDKSED